MAGLTRHDRDVCSELGIDPSRLVSLRRALDSKRGRYLEGRMSSRVQAALLVGFRQGLLYGRTHEPGLYDTEWQ